MKSTSAFKQGWQQLWQGGKMVLLFYALTLLFALMITSPLSSTLEAGFGNSMSVEKLTEGFDYTVITDFFRGKSDIINMISGQLLWMGLGFWLLTIFLTGGVLEVFKQKNSPFQFADFWKGAGQHFWRLWRLSVYFLIFQIILLLVFGGIYMAIVGGISPDDLKSEVTLITNFRILFPFYLLLAIFLFVVHDYAKIHTVHQPYRRLLTRPIWESFQLVFHNFLPFMALFVFCLILLALGAYGYRLFLSNTLASDGVGLVLILLVGQLFLLFRIVIRLLHFGGATALYQDKYFNFIHVKPVIFEEEE